MALVQISWKDNANNEDEFKVYRSTSSTPTSSDSLIATIALSSGTWGITGSTGTNHQLTSNPANTGNAATTGETFTITYTESTPATYYYGVLASNDVGNSNLIASNSSVIVTA